MTQETRWKFLHLDSDNNTIISNHDHSSWRVGVWRTIYGAPRLCDNDFHCSPDPLKAMSYTNGEVVAQVEVDGDADVDTDKSAHEKMRILRAWRWTAHASVELALYAATQALPRCVVQRPSDRRPQEVLALVASYLETGSLDSPAAKQLADGLNPIIDEVWREGYEARLEDNAKTAACYAAADALRACRMALRSAMVAAEGSAYYACDYARSATNEAENAEPGIREKSVAWVCARVETLEPLGVERRAEQSAERSRARR